MAQLSVAPFRTIRPSLSVYKTCYVRVSHPRRAPAASPQQLAKRSWRVHAEPESSKPTPSKQDAEEELPPWVRREKEKALQEKQGQDLPFGVYLLLSAIVAIASIGSIFEFVNKNPIFGVVQPDSFLYTPILGLFALTGLPTSGYLFFKSIQSANKAAEMMDKVDGY